MTTTATLHPRHSWPDTEPPPTMTVARITLDTRSGLAATERDLHSVLSWAYEHHHAGRVLWCRPSRDLVVTQADVPPATERLSTLTTRPVRTGTTRTAWPAGTTVALAGILNPAAHHRRPDGRTTRTTELLDLLALVTHLGARHRNGFGAVSRWSVEPGGDADAWRDRPMPPEHPSRAPYWHPGRRAPC